jgi:hypothetical protein
MCQWVNVKRFAFFFAKLCTFAVKKGNRKGAKEHKVPWTVDRGLTGLSSVIQSASEESRN